MSIAQRVRPIPPYPPGWLVGQLPVGMRDDELLVRFTTIFERLAETLRAGADNVDHVADPTVATQEMLAYLGRWLGYDLVDHTLDVRVQRDIIRALGRAMPLRGTAAGLRQILEAVTRGPVQIEESGGVIGADDEVPSRAPVVVTVATPGHLREHELRALVRDEVPAHVPVRVVITGQGGGT